MQQSAVDRLYMRAALRLAERGLYTVTRGNPRVGCLIVNNNKVVGRGWHQFDGEGHAEVHALRSAGESARGATAYVTLEPCCFEGRTSACTEALVGSGISRVVVGSRDTHPRVRGRGIKVLQSAGLKVKLMGLPQPGELNPGIYMRNKYSRPFVRIKTALSLDGRTALASGASQWITGSAARRDVQRWRARSGAIITGIGTVLADDPKLTVRETEYQGQQPWRVVLDGQGRFPVEAEMLKYPGKVIVVVGSDAGEVQLADGHEVWREDESEINVGSVLSKLADAEVNEVLVEAGSRVVGSFIESKKWDEMIAYVAPKFMGSDARALAEMHIHAMASCVAAEIVSIDSLGQDLRIVLKSVQNET